MDSIDFKDFKVNGVLGTDTFETWRQKTNGIISEVDAISSAEYVLSSEALLLNASAQTVVGPTTFNSSIELGLLDNVINLSYDIDNKELTFSKPINVNGSISSHNIICTGESISINNVEYTWPSVPNDGYFSLVNGTIIFTSLSEIVNQVQSEIASNQVSVMAELMPVGSIIAYDTNSASAPSDWLWCNGATYTKGQYPYLALALGLSQSAPDETTFTVPNLTGKVLLNTDAGLSLRDSIGTIDKTTDADDLYVTRYIIKANRDNTVLFSLTSGNGISLTGPESSSTLDLQGGSISINSNPTQFQYSNGQLNIKAGGITNDRLANASVSSSNNTIPIRSDTGQIRVALSPIADNDAASKNYVDNLSAQGREYRYLGINSTGFNSYTSHPSIGSCYIDVEGNVIVYGSNTTDRFGKCGPNAYGHNINTIRDNDVKKVYSDDYNTYILYNNGKVYSYGFNTNCKTGSTSTLDVAATVDGPRLAFNGEQISEIILSHDVNSQTVYALTTSGALWVAGNNSHGQFGDGTTISTSNTKLPFKIQQSGVSKAWLIGSYLTQTGYILTSDGFLLACGCNLFGQTGRGNTTTQNRWLPVLNTTQIQKTGISNVSTTYTLNAHGMYDYDQLVIGSTVYVVKVLSANTFNLYTSVENAWSESNKVSVPITSGICYTRLRSVSDAYPGGNLGSTFCFAKLSDGSLYSWGYNQYGNLGLGDTTTQRTRANLCNTNVKDVYTEFGATVHLIKNDNRLFATGDNRRGSLGINSSAPFITTFTEIIPDNHLGDSGIPSPSDAVVYKFFSVNGYFASGIYYNSKFCIYKSNNKYYLTAWGDNQWARLGTDSSNEPFLRRPTKVYFTSDDIQWISDIASYNLNGGLGITILVKRALLSGETIQSVPGKLYIAGYQNYNHNCWPTGAIIPYFTRVKNI